MKTIVLATGNSHKASEIKALLGDLPLDIKTLRDYPALLMPPEDSPDFAGNALVKAEAVAGSTGEIALADDSGLAVDALGGRPGVFSARFAGEGAGDEANNRLLLRELKDIPPEKRTAAFICAIAVVVPGGKNYVVEESCRGKILESPRGEGGFGYDPLFYYEPAGATFAEMDPGEKNKVSHRGKALRRVRELLAGLL